MEKTEYEVMFNIEEDYWWYKGLRDLTLFYINSVAGDNIKILDGGCGTGKFLELCKAYRAFGFDISEETLKFLRLRKLNNIVLASICDIPFKDKSFNIAVSMDVLYHMSVRDDRKALKEMYRIIDNRGILLLNLPAYDFIRSSHDKAVHTRHRYTLREVKENVEHAGFIIERITYRNTILFPLAVSMRFMENLFPGKKKTSDLKKLPGFFNNLFTSIIFLENRLIRCGISFPFGLSVYCVASKK
ncbi:MAG TPA: class I SAM-dependent methyltransferase [Candidatus Eremiobacteraeota bacterium]|nr:MAG: hypothetical protein BWY64_03519 [bacterium ADurb.Bin363]HPZ08152.1 class I SAM-dependent methyltransferase [Candidatus Eremiobacteraeota bacterium]